MYGAGGLGPRGVRRFRGLRVEGLGFRLSWGLGFGAGCFLEWLIECCHRWGLIWVLWSLDSFKEPYDRGLRGSHHMSSVEFRWFQRAARGLSGFMRVYRVCQCF